MNLFKKIVNKQEKNSVVGVGNIGRTIAVAIAKKVDIISFDLNEKKIELCKAGIDPIGEHLNEI